MKRAVTLIFLLVCFLTSGAQTLADSYTGRRASHNTDIRKVNFNGQWRGSFNETTPNMYGYVSKIRTTYVLELEVNGSLVKGYSYTYFNDPGEKRYYTICRITGSLDRKLNKLVITEVERVKYNTPPEMRNCFQIHSLRYFKGDDNSEYLKGDWVPAPNQSCGGKGETILSRQVVSRVPFGVTLHPKKESPVKKPTSPDVAHARPDKKQSVPVKPYHKVPEISKPETTISSGVPVESDKSRVPQNELSLDKKHPHPVYKGYESRKNVVMKSIQIENPVFQIDLYDNGEIDGDSISVFYNGKLILSHKRLSDQPISVTLSLDKSRKENVLTMYAENLGTIPPNTAVMIVRDGGKRYEVRMESDMGKSGTVVFTHDDKDD